MVCIFADTLAPTAQAQTGVSDVTSAVTAAFTVAQVADVTNVALKLADYPKDPHEYDRRSLSASSSTDYSTAG